MSAESASDGETYRLGRCRETSGDRAWCRIFVSQYGHVRLPDLAEMRWGTRRCALGYWRGETITESPNEGNYTVVCT